MRFRETLTDLLEPLTRLKELKISRERAKNILLLSALGLILAAAFLIRTLPAKWGVYLHEFDPYLQYRVTKRILDKGFTSWLNWRDYKSWYPYGRDMTRSIYPGLPMTAAVFYLVANAIGVSMPLQEFLCYFPPIMAVLTCIVVFYLGKEYGGIPMALLSALFMAVCPAYISRTHLGWFDDETVGIFALSLISLFYVRAVDPRRSLRESLIYGALTGLTLGYLFASWGTARYALGLIALTTLLIALRDYRPKHVATYGVIVCLGLAIAVNVPRLGISVVKEITGVASLGVFVLLAYGLLLRRVRGNWKRLIMTAGFIGCGALILYGAWSLGYISGLPTKYYAVLEPLSRLSIPLIQSVGEHRPATWNSLFTSLGFLLAFIPVYVFMAVQELDNKHLFLLTYLLTSLYSAASYVRLELVLAAPACLAGAYVIYRLSSSMARMVKSRVSTRKLAGVLSKEAAIAFTILLLLVSVAPLVYFGVRTANTPVTIASSSIPVGEFRGDWLEALKWLKENVPDDAVVMSWWDYGYWLTIVGNKTTLADNATLNSTQIAVIARTFMSPEEEALKTMKRYHVNYVVLFVDFIVYSYGGYYYYIPEGFGEENKFIWMIRIAGLNESDYIADGKPTMNFTESLIGKLIPFKYYEMGGGIYIGPSYYRSKYIEPVFYSSSLETGGYNGRVTGVVIYKVTYPPEEKTAE